MHEIVVQLRIRDLAVDDLASLSLARIFHHLSSKRGQSAGYVSGEAELPRRNAPGQHQEMDRLRRTTRQERTQTTRSATPSARSRSRLPSCGSSGNISTSSAAPTTAAYSVTSAAASSAQPHTPAPGRKRGTWPARRARLPRSHTRPARRVAWPQQGSHRRLGRRSRCMSGL
jgi:hypothetical protein